MLNFLGAIVVVAGLCIRLAYRKLRARFRQMSPQRVHYRSTIIGPPLSQRLAKYSHPP